jgi:hypothetical protein
MDRSVNAFGPLTFPDMAIGAPKAQSEFGPVSDLPSVEKGGFTGSLMSPEFTTTRVATRHL